MSADDNHRDCILPPHAAPTSKLPPAMPVSRGKRLSNALRCLSHEAETMTEEALDVVEEMIVELRQKLR